MTCSQRARHQDRHRWSARWQYGSCSTCMRLPQRYLISALCTSKMTVGCMGQPWPGRPCLREQGTDMPPCALQLNCTRALAAGEAHAAVQRDHDQQGGEAAARLPGGPSQSGGDHQVPHRGHPAPAVPLHPRQIQGRPLHVRWDPVCRLTGCRSCACAAASAVTSGPRPLHACKSEPGATPAGCSWMEAPAPQLHKTTSLPPAGAARLRQGMQADMPCMAILVLPP